MHQGSIKYVNNAMQDPQIPLQNVVLDAGLQTKDDGANRKKICIIWPWHNNINSLKQAHRGDML